MTLFEILCVICSTLICKLLMVNRVSCSWLQLFWPDRGVATLPNHHKFSTKDSLTFSCISPSGEFWFDLSDVSVSEIWWWVRKCVLFIIWVNCPFSNEAISRSRTPEFSECKRDGGTAAELRGSAAKTRFYFNRDSREGEKKCPPPPAPPKLTHHNIYTQSSSGAWNESLLHSSSSWLAQLTLCCVHGCVCVHAPVKTGALSLELVLVFVSVSFLLLDWPNVLVFSPLFQSIMEQFNPCLRNFIAMGKSYEKALTSEYTNHFLFSLCLRPSFIPPVCLSSSPGRGQTDPTLEAAFISS